MFETYITQAYFAFTRLLSRQISYNSWWLQYCFLSFSIVLSKSASHFSNGSWKLSSGETHFRVGAGKSCANKVIIAGLSTERQPSKAVLCTLTRERGSVGSQFSTDAARVQLLLPPRRQELGGDRLKPARSASYGKMKRNVTTTQECFCLTLTLRCSGTDMIQPLRPTQKQDGTVIGRPKVTAGMSSACLLSHIFTQVRCVSVSTHTPAHTRLMFRGNLWFLGTISSSSSAVLFWFSLSVLWEKGFKTSFLYSCNGKKQLSPVGLVSISCSGIFVCVCVCVFMFLHALCSGINYTNLSIVLNLSISIFCYSPLLLH